MAITTNVDLDTIDKMLKESIIQEVKGHLLKLIDNELNKLSRDAVQRFLEIHIDKEMNPISFNDNVYFSFVQKITKTVKDTVVVVEKDIK